MNDILSMNKTLRMRLEEASRAELYNKYYDLSVALNQKGCITAGEFASLSKNNKIYYLLNMCNRYKLKLEECWVKATTCDYGGFRDFFFQRRIMYYNGVEKRQIMTHKTKNWLRENKIEHLNYNIFRVGDKVRSVMGEGKNSFRGTIIEFETLTNRVICVSDKGNLNDRRRYAYLPSEISILLDKQIKEKEEAFTVTLLPGMKLRCKIEEELKNLFVVEYPGNDNLVLLCENNSTGIGNYVFCLPKNVKQEHLERAGIQGIKITLE